MFIEHNYIEKPFPTAQHSEMTAFKKSLLWKLLGQKLASFQEGSYPHFSIIQKHNELPYNETRFIFFFREQKLNLKIKILLKFDTKRSLNV